VAQKLRSGVGGDCLIYDNVLDDNNRDPYAANPISSKFENSSVRSACIFIVVYFNSEDKLVIRVELVRFISDTIPKKIVSYFYSSIAI
jgi:hypothetical protein